MLQQTQVTTVIPYYERFMQRFPDVRALAAAPVDEVLHLWTGLGYYARARNLHRAAQLIAGEHGGEFPMTIDAVQALPGIGRSTAGAILALSHVAAASDSRRQCKARAEPLFRRRGISRRRGDRKKLWSLADRCTPASRVAHYTQAIMDLGATVCVRTRPVCGRCPLQRECVARIEGRQSLLPTPRPKKVRPQRVAHIVILTRDDGAVLLERRPPVGVWGGLWMFPQFESSESAYGWLRLLRGAKGRTTLPPYSHAFTHFDLTLHPIVVRAGGSVAVADADRYCWYDAKQAREDRPRETGSGSHSRAGDRAGRRPRAARGFAMNVAALSAPQSSRALVRIGWVLLSARRIVRGGQRSAVHDGGRSRRSAVQGPSAGRAADGLVAHDGRRGRRDHRSVSIPELAPQSLSGGACVARSYLSAQRARGRTRRAVLRPISLRGDAAGSGFHDSLRSPGCSPARWPTERSVGATFSRIAAG